MLFHAFKKKTLFSNITPVKLLMFLTAGLSLFAVLFDRLFMVYFGSYSPFALLGLSAAGVQNFFLWQLLSYVFIHPVHEGFSLGFLLYLAFNCYILWFSGSSIVARRGERQFLNFFFSTAFFTGLAVTGLLLLFHSPMIYVGNQAILYSLLTAWVLLFPTAQVRLFLFLPMQAKWLVGIMVGMSIFVDLSNGNFINLFANSFAVLFTYLYSVIAWKVTSPFKSLNKFEIKLMQLANLFKRGSKKKKSTKVQGGFQTKIYDFKTGEAIEEAVILDPDKK